MYGIPVEPTFFLYPDSSPPSSTRRHADVPIPQTELALTTISEQGKYTVTLIEGDGIGPEISKSVKDIFAAANVTKKKKTFPSQEHDVLKQYRCPSNGNRLMLLPS